jgi:hypothetical protein
MSKLKLVNIVANPPAVKPVQPPALKILDAHSLAHRKNSKAAKACDGADILDGRVSLQNLTGRLVAQAQGVSQTYIAAARRLTPAQRDAVRRGERALVPPAKPALPAQPAQLPAPFPPAVVAESAEQRLRHIVGEIGVVEALNLLAEIDRAA